MVDHHPVQTSAVFLLGPTAQRTLVPPPSPPSPLTPSATCLTTPIEELYLDDGLLSTSLAEENKRANERISGAIHVLNTEATSLRNLTTLYEADPVVGAGFNSAIEVITRHKGQRGKVVVIGVGKSGHIGKKLVASFNSLGVRAVYLHPTEALHGDLGEIGKNDTVLFITFSGKTPELLLLLPHIDTSLPTIVLTSHTRPETCELIRQRPSMILLSAPIHESETTSFGVSAPTTSTTMAIAVGDALAIVSSRELHASVSATFLRNHPGGAIGATSRKPTNIMEIATPICEIDALPCRSILDVRGGDVLKAAYDSATGWVQIGDLIASPNRIRRLDSSDFLQKLCDLPGLGASREEWIAVSGDTRISQAAEWIKDMRSSPEEHCDEHSIVAVIEGDDVIGVLEAGQLLSWKD
ncbi:putative SIS domain-containing protein [Seiridium cardinale]|uniref:SIS domain-containing protein n=1 Tax=Seiridium cardinale TaxID=138064 RepID=A0ABR2XRZ1_9PEZI